MEFTTATIDMAARPLQSTTLRHPIAGMIEDKLYEFMDEWITNDNYWSTTTKYMCDIPSDIYGKDQDMTFNKWVLSYKSNWTQPYCERKRIKGTESWTYETN